MNSPVFDAGLSSAVVPGFEIPLCAIFDEAENLAATHASIPQAAGCFDLCRSESHRPGYFCIR